MLRGGENKGENAELQLAKDLKTLLGGDKSWPKRDCSVSVSLLCGMRSVSIFYR